MTEGERKPVQNLSAGELATIDNALGMAIDLMDALRTDLDQHPVKAIVVEVSSLSRDVRAKVRHYQVDAELMEAEAKANE